MKPSAYLETEQLAKALKVHINTIYLWVQRGLPCYRATAPKGRYRFLLPEVQAWLKSTPRPVGRPLKDVAGRAA